jgi:hypothetical protein
MKKKIVRTLWLVGVLWVGASAPALAQAGNIATVYQTGNANAVTIEQAGSANVAATHQEGDGNRIEVEQVAAVSSHVTVQQHGSSNEAQVSQTALAGWTTASLEQKGSRNVAQITQTSTSGYDVADLYQEGQDNDTRIHQSAPGDNTLDVRQWGGSPGSPGNDNLAWLSQGAATVNLAFLEQMGNDNRLFGATSAGAIDPLEYAYQYAVTGGNELHLYQEGNGNSAGLYQWSAAGNYADIRQLYDGNTVGIYQIAYGGTNYVTVDQNGQNTGGSAVVSQIALTGNNTAHVSHP